MKESYLMRYFIVLTLLGAAVTAAPAVAQVPQNSDALVRSWYQRFLHRDVDPGYIGWVNALNSGSSPTTVLSEILGSDEYYNAAGGTPQGFVQSLFRDIAGRTATEREYRSLLPRLSFGNRNEVAYTLLLRYPQTWSVATYPAPVTPLYPPQVDRDRRDYWKHEQHHHWDHDRHDYRRPYWHNHW
jgi:hypothetical protein